MNDMRKLMESLREIEEDDAVQTISGARIKWNFNPHGMPWIIKIGHIVYNGRRIGYAMQNDDGVWTVGGDEKSGIEWEGDSLEEMVEALISEYGEK